MLNSQLLRYQDNQKYLLFDVETESLNLFFSRPWQISYALCNNKEIEWIKVRYIHWADLDVGVEAARITRFNKNFYLERAEDAKLVLNDFEQLIYSPELMGAGHNILGFDVYQIATWRRLLGRSYDDSYIPRLLDTNCLAKAYKKGFEFNGNRLAFQYKLLNFQEKGLRTSLGVMCKEFGIDYDDKRAHDAEYDTKVNHGVLKELLWKVNI